MYSKTAALVRRQLEIQPFQSGPGIERATRLSRATVNRTLAELGTEVVKLGRARATRYALAEPLFGLDAHQPVRLIKEDGSSVEWGTIHRITGNHLALEAGKSVWSSATIPWPLAPIRRQGFLGRLAAERVELKAVLGVDVDRWPAAGHVYAAAVQGADLPGALVVGSPVAAKPLDARAGGVKARASLYEEAIANLQGFAPGSSAGGDQPKLTATAPQGDVIVKYSPPKKTPFGIRWNDLLRAEAAALETLAEAGETVAAAEILPGTARTFLESTRFDRIGANGRRHVIALGDIHDAFLKTPRQHWADTCQQLVAQGRLPPEDLQRARRWRAFGRLIANTDMHFGNLSLFVSDFTRGTFTLAPCYDMLPMQYRPGLHREDLGPTPFTPPEPAAEERGVWDEATRRATTFWKRTGKDPHVSAEWKAVAAENARRTR